MNPFLDEIIKLTPSQIVYAMSSALDEEFYDSIVVGEVASFKISQGKWVFFDLKDEECSVNCFMPVWDLRVPIEDGMKIEIEGTPKVTKWGKLSLTVKNVKPVGKGNIKKAYEMLKLKLKNEGLFDVSIKRKIHPEDLKEIGVISSTQAAGYADFTKILNARWGGLKLKVAHTQVQGVSAPDQIIRALDYFNERGDVDVIAILRGGGSADDLACFNDEKLVRKIAASKIPVITGIGHEVDETLADFAADVRASTPSNAAEMLTRDRKTEKEKISEMIFGMEREITQEILLEQKANREKVEKVGHGLVMKYINPMLVSVERKVQEVGQGLMTKYVQPILQATESKIRQMSQKLQGESKNLENSLKQKMRTLEALNPEKVLKQGYAILSGKVSPGNVVKITTFKQDIKAEIKEIYDRKNDLK